MRSGVYFRCPFCGKNYQGIIPKRGDGTGAILPKHYKIIPNSNNMGLLITPGRKIICAGSYHLFELKEGL